MCVSARRPFRFGNPHFDNLREQKSFLELPFATCRFGNDLREILVSKFQLGFQQNTFWDFSWGRGTFRQHNKDSVCDDYCNKDGSENLGKCWRIPLSSSMTNKNTLSVYLMSTQRDGCTPAASWTRAAMHSNRVTRWGAQQTHRTSG